MHIELNLPSCNSFLSQMADTSMTILSKDLFRVKHMNSQYLTFEPQDSVTWLQNLKAIAL